MSELRGYHRTISEAIQVEDIAVLIQVEDIMRNDIFHSTLDWIGREQFMQGAREAYELRDFINNSLHHNLPGVVL